MVGTVALALSLALAHKSVIEADFSVDLFLVANNKSVLQNLDWLDHPKDDESVERLLRPAIRSLDAKKIGFVVLDGADCSIFPTTGKDRDLRYIRRNYSRFDSKTEGTTQKNGTKTRVLEGIETIGTEWGGLFARPFGKNSGYVAQHFMYFGSISDTTRSAAFQDLNSYHTAIKGGMPQDTECLSRTVLLTGDSIQESKKFLREHNYDFNGICIGKWGLTDPSDPNFIAFPPQGVVSHYKLFRKQGKWGVQLLEQLGLAATGGH